MEHELEIEKIGEKCGVFGVYAPQLDVVEMAHLGLFELQHRGQEGAGIAVSQGDRIMITKGIGEVSEAFGDGDQLNGLEAKGIASGHVRYSTIAVSDAFDAVQPILGEARREDFALSHNGNLPSFEQLCWKYNLEPAEMASDSALLVELIKRSMDSGNTLPQATKETLAEIEGAYSLVIMGQHDLIGARDPHGYRPLSIGQLPGGGYILASETPALSVNGATFMRDVEPGEMVVINHDGLRSHRFAEAQPQQFCAFEYIYFARPDSNLLGQNVHLAREQMGRFLAIDAPPPEDADMVIGVPDSGISAALGYAKQSGLDYEQGLTKSRYIKRTFMKQNQLTRQQAVRMKLHANPAVIQGKNLVVVDDSIVRGNTQDPLIDMLRKAGAKSVHFRVHSDMYRFGCHYGMDTSDTSLLLANGKTKEEIERHVGADSLEFLSTERIRQALAKVVGGVCMACMDGNYATSVPVEFSNGTI